MRSLPLEAAGFLSIALTGLALGAAPAAAETEPNNPISGAEILTLANTTTGTCADGPDFLSYYVQPMKRYQIAYNFAYAYGATTTVQLFEQDETMFANFSLSSSGTLAFSATALGRYFVGLTCNGNAGGWSINVTEEGDATNFQGADEVEHNDIQARASPINAGGDLQGSGAASGDPVDYWQVPFNGLGGVRVGLVAPNLTATLNTIDGAGRLVAVQGEILVRLSPTLPLTFAVKATAGAGNYTLHVDLRANVSMFFAGADEVEPNNINLHATNFTLSAKRSLEGVLDPALDPVDVYRFTVSGPYIVSAHITAGACSPDCPSIEALDAQGAEVPGARDPVGPGTVLTFPEVGGASFYIVGRAGEKPGDYALVIDLKESPYPAGTVLAIGEANKTNALGVIFLGNETVRLPGLFGKINLWTGGANIIYGQTIDVYVRNKLPVEINITVAPGTRLKPEIDEVISFVVTRPFSIRLAPGQSTDFALVAVAETSNGTAPDEYVFFEIAGSATGNEAKIVRETANGTYSWQAEIIAMWALNDGMNRADLEDWGANDPQINEAGQLLYNAGVSTAITAAPPPPPPPNPGTSGTSSTSPSSGPNPLLIIGGVLFLLVALGAVARRSAAKKRQAAAMAPPQPSVAAYPPGATPSSPGYYTYPGAVPASPGLPTYPAAPPPAAPPPRAPPRPPSTAPMYASLAAAAPAAPAPAALAPPAEMSNCPQCNASIAIGAPKCAVCGLDIVWG